MACAACRAGHDTGPMAPGPSGLTIRVQGTIASAEDGQPVAGAWVRLLEWASLDAGHLDPCAQTSTDGDGLFSLSCSGRSCLMAPGGYLSGPFIATGAAGYEILFPVMTECTSDLQVFTLALVPER